MWSVHLQPWVLSSTSVTTMANTGHRRSGTPPVENQIHIMNTLLVIQLMLVINSCTCTFVSCMLHECHYCTNFTCCFSYTIKVFCKECSLNMLVLPAAHLTFPPYHHPLIPPHPHHFPFTPSSTGLPGQSTEVCPQHSES